MLFGAHAVAVQHSSPLKPFTDHRITAISNWSHLEAHLCCDRELQPHNRAHQNYSYQHSKTRYTISTRPSPFLILSSSLKPGESWGQGYIAYACQRLPAGMTITYNIMVITGQPVVTTCIPDRGASTSSLMSLVICVKLLLPYRQTDRQQALLWPLTLDQYTIIQYTMHINYNLAAHAGWSHDYFAILCSSVC